MESAKHSRGPTGGMRAEQHRRLGGGRRRRYGWQDSWGLNWLEFSEGWGIDRSAWGIRMPVVANPDGGRGMVASKAAGAERAISIVRDSRGGPAIALNHSAKFGERIDYKRIGGNNHCSQ